MSNIENAKRMIGERVEVFARNREQYRAPEYKEAQLRIEFLDPFFEALGWDVANKQGWAEQYKEVVNEDALKIAGTTKAPDYSFRIGGARKFFAEAKKPALTIKSDATAAYQLRRYAWSAQLPLSILSDFEELAVYDCRARPFEKDSAKIGRVNFFTFEQYLDRLPEIFDVFSKDAVLRGSFDRYAQEQKGRGTAPVDAEFLKEIEGWRVTLARNFALLNPRLGLDELNDAVQRTIDRIIFLRMAEDRGAEEYGRLRRLAYPLDPAEAEELRALAPEQIVKLGALTGDKGGVYARLVNLCRDADDKYNSGLFDFDADKLTPSLIVDDDKLRGIIGDLYYPRSPYEFSVLAADTLGNVYEQFLGKVIRLTPAHQAKIEEKPEVKKAGGVFYTPTYIVEYVVKQTVGKMIAGKSPEELVGTFDKTSTGRAFFQTPLRVLDPACGSGSFLLGAYQCLLDHCLNWYVAHRDDKQSKNKIYESAKGWRLTTAEKKRILTTHIFGVDIDRQAVEVTKLSLLLKVLEDETRESLGKQLALFKEPALPNLDANIKCGNSLIGTDYFAGRLLPDKDELRRVNPMDWAREFPDAFTPTPALPRSQTSRTGEGVARPPLSVNLPTGEGWGGGFDCVIGNPPYVRMETFKDLKEYLKKNYAVHDERSDLYAYFIERAHKLLNKSGYFGMIVSNKFVRANYGKPLRDFLAQNAMIERIADFAGLPVFVGATVRTIVLITSRRKDGEPPTLYSPPPVEKFSALTSGSISVEQAIADLTYPIASDALMQPIWSFAKRESDDLLRRLQTECVPLAKYCEGQICRGVVSGLTEAFVIDEKTRAAILKANSRAEEIIKPFLNGRDVRRYSIDPPNIYLIYTFHGVDITRYPGIEKHLKPFKEKLVKRATRQEWYELQQPQYNFAKFMDAPKIIFPDIATTPRFALDDTGYYSSNTTYFIPRRDLYLLGLLNSRLALWYFTLTCAGLEGKKETYLRFFGQYLEGFPIRTINPDDAHDIARYHRVIALVEQMLELHKQRTAARTAADRELIQRQIDATDAQIDAVVYALYGLTEEEIGVVEGA
ncbi:MAG: restriction endonuclease subunit R [Chloroflexi bacterium]|nr:restriction endonuclease subunit R [Chloroflexota bacterium]